ncbi:hypothetical protein [Streptomyces sp. NPDC048462]|uniref:hypothetical protein n=1 Tax=Streptomyces sp. NPDC048462 TaxID=3365555 RepID=UPI003714F4CF
MSAGSVTGVEPGSAGTQGITPSGSTDDWGSRWLPAVPELSIRAQLLARGGPEMGERFMDELRATHLEGRPQRADGVLAELTLAYERAVPEGAVSELVVSELAVSELVVPESAVSAGAGEA